MTTQKPDSEYVAHIGRILMKSLETTVGLQPDLEDSDIVRSRLREFFRIRAVDAMEWTLKCAIGAMDFDQAIEDEIPILCKYYNDFLGEGEWTESDCTMMMVLNKYEQIKAGRYGNFALALSLAAS